MSKKKNKKKNRSRPRRDAQPLLSLCMIVKNEEKNLERCLSSAAPFFDQIVVVDTGSTDRTVDIAEKYGAEVHFFEWIDDFSAARNVSLEHAHGKFIVWLDADDYLPEESGKLIRQAAVSGKRVAYFLLLKNIKSDLSCTKMYQMRMFPNTPGVRFEHPIHEQVTFSLKELNIPFDSIDAEIHHWGYHDDEAMHGKHSRALEILESQLRKEPENFSYNYYYGLSSLGTKSYENAITGFDRVAASPEALKKRPDMYFHARILKGKALEDTGNIDGAEKVYREILKEAPQYFLALYTLGEILYNSGRTNEAKENFEGVINREIPIPIISIPVDSVRFVSYYRLATIAGNDENYDEAIQLLQRASSIYPEEPKPLISLANIFRKIGRVRDAVSEYERLIRLEPDSPAWPLEIGNCMMVSKKMAEAAEAYRDVADKFPEYFPASANLAKTLYSMKRFDEALPYAENANRLNPEDSFIHKLLGDLYSNSGRFADSVKYYEVYLTKNPADYAVFTRLAFNYLEQKAIRSALLGFRQALALNPSYPPAQYGLSTINKQHGDLVEAMAESSSTGK